MRSMLKGCYRVNFFQVVAIIENMSPEWKDFKNYLKHMQDEMNDEDLIVRFRIEKYNREI